MKGALVACIDSESSPSELLRFFHPPQIPENTRKGKGVIHTGGVQVHRLLKHSNGFGGPRLLVKG